MNNFDLAQIIREAREIMNISQRKLAELVGTNQTEISFIERGFIPSEEKIDAIYKLYIKSKKGE